jgi:uncharacterized protein YcbX
LSRDRDVPEQAARRGVADQDGTEPNARRKHRIVQFYPDAEHDRRHHAAGRAHETTEGCPDEQLQVFRNTDCRLAAARQHGHLHVSIAGMCLPGERSANARDDTSQVRFAPNDVDKQIEVVLWHLTIDDDLVLQLGASTRERRLVRSAIDCRQRRKRHDVRRLNTVLGQCVVDILRVDSSF